MLLHSASSPYQRSKRLRVLWDHPLLRTQWSFQSLDVESSGSIVGHERIASHRRLPSLQSTVFPLVLVLVDQVVVRPMDLTLLSSCQLFVPEHLLSKVGQDVTISSSFLMSFVRVLVAHPMQSHPVSDIVLEAILHWPHE